MYLRISNHLKHLKFYVWLLESWITIFKKSLITSNLKNSTFLNTRLDLSIFISTYKTIYTSRLSDSPWKRISSFIKNLKKKSFIGILLRKMGRKCILYILHLKDWPMANHWTFVIVELDFVKVACVLAWPSKHDHFIYPLILFFFSFPLQPQPPDCNSKPLPRCQSLLSIIFKVSIIRKH